MRVVSATNPAGEWEPGRRQAEARSHVHLHSLEEHQEQPADADQNSSKERQAEAPGRKAVRLSPATVARGLAMAG